MNEILKELRKWWKDEKTCSGRPHCTIDECDLCVDCYEELKERLRKVTKEQ